MEYKRLSKNLIEKAGNGTALIGVIGLGYVGLPLCKAFADGGVRVLGFDLDPYKVRKLAEGKSYIGHIADDVVTSMAATDRFEATGDFDRLTEPDAILIAVPTPLDKMRQPDLSYVESSCEAVSHRLRKGQLVVLESTTYPGTTSEIVVPILEKGSALNAREDFFVAYSPEREDPGRQSTSTKTIPKVVGGYTPEALDAAEAIYRIAVDQTVPVSTCEAAEACKILENTYRAVNIAMVNELKMLFDRMGIDLWEVIGAAKTKPFGFTAFYPGPGLGGHCIPIDPFYLSWKARQYEQPTRFIELAGEINCGMPTWVVHKVMDALNRDGKALRGAKILLIGLAYKPDVDDDRESPSYKLLELLEHKGALVNYHDPHVPVIRPTREYPQFAGRTSTRITPEAVSSYDCVLVSTDHKAVDYDLLAAHARLIVDSRSVPALNGKCNRYVKA
jgi:UDP-N-acetyl-D-glucosamine dehydrogenase